MTKALSIYGLTENKVDRIASIVAKHSGDVDAEYISSKFNLPMDKAKLVLSDAYFVVLVKHHASLALNRDGYRAAVGLLLSVAQDETVAHGHRLKAAELILSRTMPTVQNEPAPAGDDGGELSADELRKIVNVIQTELSDRSKPVDAPNGAQVTVIEGKADPVSCFD